jgi:hypothetical protein
VSRPVYSTLLVAEPIIAGTPGGLIIPTGGDTIVIRDIEVWTSAGNIGAIIQALIQPNVIFFEWNNLAAGDNWKQWSGRVVVGPGFAAEFQASAYNWFVTCSGYVLTP